MPDLREQLQQCLQRRVCLLGLGNVDYGDDGFGVRLAEELDKAETRRSKAEGNPNPEGRSHPRESGHSEFGFRPSFGLWPSGFGFQRHVIVAGTEPERFIGRLADEGYDHIIFLDAVEFGGAPGSVVLLNSEEMVARFPQVSTHKLSLGLLARQIEANGRSKAWLLGVQPESVRPGGALSPNVQATLELLRELLNCLYSVGARTTEPQRRDERGEVGEGRGAQTNHYSMTDLQVTGLGLPQRPSRLCGLTELCTIEGLLLRGVSTEVKS
jgi:hydrogenase maturation protease